MNIIAHRGYWLEESEKNSLKAIEKAFKNGYGIETDIRDYKGELVISHNIADDSCPKLKEVFDIYKSFDSNTPLALNVKADGIQDLLEKQLKEYEIKNYFMFDMSIPEMVVYNDRNFKFFTRNSDIEKECVLYEKACGVWVDAFYNDRDIETAIKTHLKNSKKVSLISPEIHKKEKDEVWKMLQKTGISNEERFYLCTDLPKEAEDFLN